LLKQFCSVFLYQTGTPKARQGGKKRCYYALAHTRIAIALFLLGERC
jgi:hypothetical protein